MRAHGATSFSVAQRFSAGEGELFGFIVGFSRRPNAGRTSSCAKRSQNEVLKGRNSIAQGNALGNKLVWISARGLDARAKTPVWHRDNKSFPIKTSATIIPES